MAKTVHYLVLRLHGGGILTREDLLSALLTGTKVVALPILAICLVGGIIDLGVERMRRAKRLRMSFVELKDEMKNMQGDPHVKAQREQVRHEVAFQGAIQSVKSAKVVVTSE